MYMRGDKMANLMTYVGGIREVAVLLGHDRDSPTAGIDVFEYADLKNIVQVLQELDDNGVARAYPATLRLLRYIRPHVDLNNDQDLQHWFRALACHLCFCRAEDHCKGRPRFRDWQDRSNEGYGRATWFIRPGKCHKTMMPAEIPAVDHDSPHWHRDLQAGHVFHLYRAMLTRRLGKAVPPEGPLFPDLDQPERACKDDSLFIRWFRSKCKAADLPDVLIDLLSLHSFRSGGATDLFNYGSRTTAITEYIQRQGRWMSACYRVYLRLQSRVVARVVHGVLSDAAAPADLDDFTDRHRDQALRNAVRGRPPPPPTDRHAPPLFAV
jgi:hypothetical protein